MPIIDGKRVRGTFTSLKLNELSSVDRPAQPGARMVIMKRDERGDVIAEVAKYVCAEDGANTFTEVIQENKFSEQIWPYTDALSQSIRSIVGDKTLTSADREGKVTASVQEFLAAVRSITPETEKRLAELINKRDVVMPKTVEQLEAEVATLKSQNEALEARATTAEKNFKDVQDAKAKEEADHAETKKALVAATDEVIKVGDTELRKSEVGEANFKVTKAIRDERDMAQFEKRAAIEFRHLPGTMTEKAAVLKSVAAMPEETRKSLETILASADKMVAAGFDRLGHRQGAEPTTKAAQGTFDEKVVEIQKRDGGTKADAMSKARRAFPDEFAAAYGGEPAVN